MHVWLLKGSFTLFTLLYTRTVSWLGTPSPLPNECASGTGMGWGSSWAAFFTGWGWSSLDKVCSLSVGGYKTWLHKQPPCLSLLCALLKQSLIVARESRTTYTQPLSSSGSGHKVEKSGIRMSCEARQLRSLTREDEKRDTYGVCLTKRAINTTYVSINILGLVATSGKTRHCSALFEATQQREKLSSSQQKNDPATTSPHNANNNDIYIFHQLPFPTLLQL